MFALHSLVRLRRDQLLGPTRLRQTVRYLSGVARWVHLEAMTALRKGEELSTDLYA